MRNADVDSLRQQIHTLLTQKQGIAALNPLDVVTQGHITVLTQLAQAVQQTALDPASIAQIGQMLQQYANAAPPSVSTLAAPQPLALPVLLPNQGFPSFSLPQFPPATGGFLPLAQQSLLPANLSGLLGNTDLSALLGAINPGTQLSVPSQPQALPVFGSGKQPDHMDVSGGANATPMGDQREHGQGRNDGVVWSVADLPRIRLVHEDLNKTYPMAVRLLYEALDLQCRQCGTRYPRSDSGRSKMDLHLDWHFRQNRRAKEKAKKAISRDWFVDEDEWVLEQEVNVRDRKVPTLFFDNEDVTVSEPVEAVSNIPAIAGETNPSCKICTEVLEKFYDEESDDWMLRGAVRVDGNLYHQVCYKDGQGKTSSRTPTPPLVGETPATEGEGLVDAVKAEKSALGSQDMVIQSIPS